MTGQPPQNWQPSPPTGGQVASPGVATKKKRAWLRRAALVVPALLVGACTGSLGGGEGTVNAVPAAAPTVTVTATVPGPTVTAKAEKPKPAPTVTVTEKAKAAPAPAPDPAPASEPDPEPEPEAAEPESNMTNSQEQAVGSAEDYLDYTHFSKKGLVEQLEHEGFSTKDAEFAVEHVEVNWNKQAAGSAKDYLDYTNFSRSGLIDQLEHEGFTPSQAEYGVNAVGL